MNGGIAFPDVAPALTPPLVPNSPPIPDRIGPEAKLAGQKRQRLGKVVYVVVACPSEDCTATASGSLRAPGAAAARRFRLKNASERIARAARPSSS
jgi:hypothetical protein